MSCSGVEIVQYVDRGDRHKTLYMRCNCIELKSTGTHQNDYK